MLHNPHRAYDKGMDDAWLGNEPACRSGQYGAGYERALQLEDEEDRKREEREQEKQMEKEYYKELERSLYAMYSLKNCSLIRRLKEIAKPKVGYGIVYLNGRFRHLKKIDLI